MAKKTKSNKNLFADAYRKVVGWKWFWIVGNLTLAIVIALVLILSLILPMAVFAAGHIHNYIVTDASYVIPTDYTSMGHAFIERHLHTCSCGDQFYETHAKVYRPHVYSSKDAKFAYTTIGGNGETLYVYRCRRCPNRR